MTHTVPPQAPPTTAAQIGGAGYARHGHFEHMLGPQLPGQLL